MVWKWDGVVGSCLFAVPMCSFFKVGTVDVAAVRSDVGEDHWPSEVGI